MMSGGFGAAAPASPDPVRSVTQPDFATKYISFGRTAWHLIWLNLIWIIHVFLGAVLLGLAPASAALTAVLRHERLGWEATGSTWSQFHASYKAQFWSANRVGWPLTLGGLALIYDYWLISANGLPGLWVTVLAMIVEAVIASLLWIMVAHFEDSAIGYWKRALVFAVAKLGSTLTLIALWAIALVAFLYLPGLGVVFGVAGIQWLSAGYILSTGVLVGATPQTARPEMTHLQLLGPGVASPSVAHVKGHR
jgi:uncharacterized membrane protein YesL